MADRLAIDVEGIPVNVKLHARVKKTRNESFKTIAPSGFPMASGDPVDTHTGKSYDKSKNRKGVPIPGQKGAYAVLSDKDVETINAGVKTKVAKLGQYAPLETVALDLAIDRYVVVPDPDVPGSEQSTSILWNGLTESGLAYVSQVSLSGGMDGLLVLYASGTRLWAAMLPFEEELYDVPSFQFEKDERAAKLFTKVAGRKQPRPFNYSGFKSEYKARRKAVIDAVLAGTTPVVEAPAPQAEAVPDLMAVLEAAAEGATA